MPPDPTRVPLPPQNIDAEQSVLGALLLAPTHLEPLITEIGLTPDHFYRPFHGDIYRAMTRLLDAGEPIDKVTVVAQMRKDGTLGTGATGPAEVEQLAAAPPFKGNVSGYAEVVMDEAMWRARQARSQAQQEAVANRDQDAYEAADALVANAGRPDSQTLSPEQMASAWLDWSQGDPTSIPTPFPGLNRRMPGGGLIPGDTTIISAWSTVGKSACVDGILDHAATQHGARSHLYINEMGPTERTTRMLAAASGVAAERLFSPQRLSQAEWKKVHAVLDKLPFGMTNCAGRSADWIARHVRANKWDLAAVDLVTQIPASKTSEWDAVSRTLTVAARQSGTHIVMVPQLNKYRLTGIELPPPTRRDLRYTDAWFQDAANVLFVHRDQQLSEDGDLATLLDTGHVRADKVRNGRPGAVRVRFDGGLLRFRELPEGLAA